jgi:hypothetical protein
MTYQERLQEWLTDIEAELVRIDAAIADQGGIQEHLAGGEQTKLHRLEALLSRKDTLEKKRMEIWKEQAKYNEGFQRPASARVVFY